MDNIHKRAKRAPLRITFTDLVDLFGIKSKEQGDKMLAVLKTLPRNMRQDGVYTRNVPARLVEQGYIVKPNFITGSTAYCRHRFDGRWVTVSINGVVQDAKDDTAGYPVNYVVRQRALVECDPYVVNDYGQPAVVIAYKLDPTSDGTYYCLSTRGALYITEDGQVKR